MEEEVLLELNQNRTIVLTDRGRIYRLVCRRITSYDWERYFAGIVVTSQQEGKERINVIDVASPRLALAEAVLVSAHGYKVTGGVELMSLPDWPTRVPLAHRLQLGETLADARPSPAETELTIHPDGEEISLAATWSAQEGRQSIQRFTGLKHILRTPTAAQHKRYSDRSSRSVVVGGSRNSKTVYPGAQPILAKLYDELVLGVEGYSVNGLKLAHRDDVIREMDMLHKVMAAQELFQPQSTASLMDNDGDGE